MAVFNQPSWLQSYLSSTVPQGGSAEIGSNWAKTYLAPVADVAQNISKTFNQEKIDEILDKASKEAAWTKKEIDYTDLGNKLLPYDRVIATQYLDKGKEQQLKRDLAAEKIKQDQAEAKALETYRNADLQIKRDRNLNYRPVYDKIAAQLNVLRSQRPIYIEKNYTEDSDVIKGIDKMIAALENEMQSDTPSLQHAYQISMVDPKIIGQVIPIDQTTPEAATVIDNQVKAGNITETEASEMKKGTTEKTEVNEAPGVEKAKETKPSEEIVSSNIKNGIAYEKVAFANGRMIPSTNVADWFDMVSTTKNGKTAQAPVIKKGALIGNMPTSVKSAFDDANKAFTDATKPAPKEKTDLEIVDALAKTIGVGPMALQSQKFNLYGAGLENIKNGIYGTAIQNFIKAANPGEAVMADDINMANKGSVAALGQGLLSKIGFDASNLTVKDIALKLEKTAKNSIQNSIEGLKSYGLTQEQLDLFITQKLNGASVLRALKSGPVNTTTIPLNSPLRNLKGFRQ